MDSLATRMHQAATDLGLPLDPDFSYVQERDDGAVHVVASVDAFPTTAEERSLFQSALHVALAEEFSDLAHVDVRVFLPPVADDVPEGAPDGVIASTRIREWSRGVHDFATDMTAQLVVSSYQCVVDAYPWAERDAMCARIPDAVQRTMTHMAQGTPDPFMMYQCVDDILPPLRSVVHIREASSVYSDVTRMLGGKPPSLLHFYEAIYLRVTQGRTTSDATRRVFDRAFRG